VHATLPLGRTHCAKPIDPSQEIYQERKEFLMTNQQQQQTGQSSQVVLDELNEQDLAAVAGGKMQIISTGFVATSQDLSRLKRYPLGIGPEVHSTRW
jgi:hypothetical protein